MNTTPDNPDPNQPPPPPLQPNVPWPGVPSSPPPPQAPRASIPVKRKPHEMVPMEPGTGMGPAISSLLKSPGSILYELTSGARPGRVAVSLWVITVFGLLVFGVVTGSISGGTQWWAAPAKITGGVLFASLICLPSLYIFAALSGMALRLNAITGILLCTTGLTALLLAGFTPLVWVFGSFGNPSQDRMAISPTCAARASCRWPAALDSAVMTSTRSGTSGRPSGS